MFALLFVLIPLSLASLFVGVADISISQLMNGDEESWYLLLNSRFPRLLAILLSGAGLSVAGLIMQQLSQNKFAAPSTAGTIDSAMLGYVLSFVLFGNGDQIWLIFLTSILGTLLFIQFINNIQFKNSAFVPLVGIIFGSVIASMSHYIGYKYDLIQNLSTWSNANFSNLLNGDFELLYLALPMTVFTYLYATRISAVGLGKDFAINLGLNYQQVLVIGVIIVSIMSSTVVMTVGQLPFLGLIVPNLVSQFFGDNLQKNIPITAILGALIVLTSDVLGRVIIFPYELPISMILSLFGGCIFIFFIFRGQRNAG